MREIDKILHNNEKVLWEEKPQFSPYLAATILSMIPGIIWLAFLSPFILFAPQTSAFYFIFFSPLILVGFLMALGAPIYRLLLYRHLWYALTDKRIVIQKGVIGRDFESVNHDRIENASVDVGVIDKLFGKNSGTVRIFTTRVISTSKGGARSAPFNFSHVTGPYQLFDLLKKTSLDVRADIEFPNAMRKGENTGYGTEYISE